MRRIVFAFVGIAIMISASMMSGMVGNDIRGFGKNGENEMKIHFSFSTPTIHYGDRYAYLTMDNITGYTLNRNEPVLPYLTKTIILPLGSKITSIHADVLSNKMIIDKKIAPSIGALIYGMNGNMQVRADYTRSIYPDRWFVYNVGVGLDGYRHVLYLTIKIYPVRYIPSANEIEYAKNMNIIIEYEGGNTNIAGDGYDLLIVAPSKFKDVLQPLIEHKERHGIKTILMTTEEIYSSYSGRDEPEKIKYAIKDAIEKYGIKYVLLAGGMKYQFLNSWWIPVRYSHLDDNSSFEASYISDLYYADIYKYDNGNIVFDNWDSNGNGIYAEWNIKNKDKLDLYPDVYVGRLACRNVREMQTVVNKIINYEDNTHNQPWFKKFIVIGGDSFPDEDVGTDYIEGQVENEQAVNFMDGFDATRIWVEGGDINFTGDAAAEIISQGCGFLYFSGHGNPASWATHPHNDFNTWIDFSLENIKSLSNGEKLPVMVVGGCHNCQFNVSIFRIFKEGIWAYYLGEMTPECWGWRFVSNANGGSISAIGNTGLGYGTIGDGPVDEIPDSVPDGIPDCIQYLDGWLEPHFFEVYNHGGIHNLGAVWGTALTDYLNNFSINWDMNWVDNPHTADLVNCKTVEEWVLFGDPSLLIGGYS
ncbi:MAG: peptidase C25 [Thermoplasmata archaeon]|nr:peptidase C25 [Thermoplasmata archaeon]